MGQHLQSLDQQEGDPQHASVHGETGCRSRNRFFCVLCWCEVCWCKGGSGPEDDALARSSIGDMMRTGDAGLCDDCWDAWASMSHREPYRAIKVFVDDGDLGSGLSMAEMKHALNCR